MIRVAGFIALGLLVLSAAVWPAGGQERKPDLKKGAELWSQNCARCHNLRPPDERSDRGWEIIVAHMRLRANLTGADARAIEEFLKSGN